jgi:hypothetical protein
MGLTDSDKFAEFLILGHKDILHPLSVPFGLRVVVE